MVRASTYKVYGEVITYLIKKSRKSLNEISKEIELDTKTLRKGMNGNSVSENVLIKFSDYFGVPITFFCDFAPEYRVKMPFVENWQKYVREIETDNDFDYYLDDDMDGSLLKTNLPLIEEFITQVASAINSNKKDSAFKRFEDFNIDVDNKLDKIKKIKDSFRIVDIAEKLSKHIDIFIGRYNFWEEDTSSMELYNYVNYIACKNQIIHFQKKSETKIISYRASLGKVPENPFKIWGKENENQGFSIQLSYHLDFKDTMFLSYEDMNEILNKNHKVK